MLRFAVVGARRGVGLAAVIAANPKCQLVAIFDPRRERAEQAATNLGAARVAASYEELLASEDIDAVVIASPMPFHATQAIAALEADKHVLSEVPAIASPEEAEPLVKAAAKSRGKYMLAENMAYFAWVQAFDTLVKEGFIGDPVYGECEYVHDCRDLMVEWIDGEKHLTWRATHLGPAQYCTHDLGPMLHIFDDRVDTVVGMNTGCRTAPDLGAIDAEVILCKTVKGRVLKFLGSFVNARHPALHYFVIYGTEGVLESPRVPEEAFKMNSPKIPHAWGMVKLPLSDSHPDLAGRVAGGGHGTCEWLMVEDFVSAVLEDRQPPIDVYTALDWSLPGALGHQSAEEGGIPKKVPDPRSWTG
ncbi:MAG: Gfo/Idh/MocA family oxidoreductase [Armatimonadetes bacterium]|nr:Gfo/Idh/MocA family oxidoreductase [Armatimonadota bacterium]